MEHHHVINRCTFGSRFQPRQKETTCTSGSSLEGSGAGLSRGELSGLRWQQLAGYHDGGSHLAGRTVNWE